jgi:L-malate glycosyltransferase
MKNSSTSIKPSLNRPLSIGIVCYPSIGGSGIVATELGKALVCRGHDVHFFSYDIPYRLTSLQNDDESLSQPCAKGKRRQFHFHHIDIPDFPLFRFPPYALALATELYEAAHAEKLDLLHVHYAIPHSTSAVLARMMLSDNNRQVVPVITTLHGTDTALIGLDRRFKPVVEFSINNCDAVTAVSNALKQQTLRDFSIRHEINVIYNPIDTETFRPVPEKRPQTPPEPFTITHISNFREIKRVDEAVMVFDLINKAMESRMIFVGAGPTMALAKQQAERLGLSDRIEFAGRVHEVQDILAKSNLLISTSEMESFGMTIAEALSSEVPIVAYDVGGIKEVVGDCPSARLVLLGDTVGMANASIELLRAHQSNPSLGENCRHRILDNFTMDKIIPQYEALYYSLLDEKT